MASFTEQYDIVVIGAGHAGCEVEPICGRERGDAEREAAGEILSGAKDPAEQSLA